MLSTPEDVPATAITVRSTKRDELPVTSLPAGRFDELFRLQQRLAAVETPAYAAFGEDEFVGCEGFRSLVDSGETLVATDIRDDDVIDSFACVVPSVFAKNYTAAIADLFIGVDSAQAKAGMFRRWLDIATAHALKLGYVTVLVQTFVTNVATFGDFHAAGFEFCADLPLTGHIRGLGMTDSVLWRKYIADRSTCARSLRRPPREYGWFFGPPRVRQDIGLPRRYTLKDGTVIEWDKLQPEDVDSYSHLFAEATDRGEGLGPDIIQCGHYTKSGAVVFGAFKTIDTCEVVGVCILRPAVYSRTVHPVVSSGAVAVRPDFVSKGLAAIIFRVSEESSISCGYDAMFGETHARHTSMLHLTIGSGWRVIGCTPDAIKLPRSGWGNVMFLYKTFGQSAVASKL